MSKIQLVHWTGLVFYNIKKGSCCVVSSCPNKREFDVDRNGSVITDYQFDKNTHTDSHFLQEALSHMERSKEEIILVTDGGYDGQDNVATF